MVVLPFVPVSAIHFWFGARTCLTCQAKSISPITLVPALLRFKMAGWSIFQPGETIANSMPFGSSLITSFFPETFSSNIFDNAPNFSSASCTALPVTPAPITKQLFPESSVTKLILGDNPLGIEQA